MTQDAIYLLDFTEQVLNRFKSCFTWNTHTHTWTWSYDLPWFWNMHPRILYNNDTEMFILFQIPMSLKISLGELMAYFRPLGGTHKSSDFPIIFEPWLSSIKIYYGLYLLFPDFWIVEISTMCSLGTYKESKTSHLMWCKMFSPQMQVFLT